MAMMTGWKRRRRGNAMVARNRCARKRLRPEMRLRPDSGRGHKSVWYQPPVLGARLLGATGRARAAHVMQFRPVGVEGPDEELAPEVADFSQNAGLSVPAGSRGGEGC